MFRTLKVSSYPPIFMGPMNPVRKNFEPCPPLGFIYIQICLRDKGHSKETGLHREKVSILEKITPSGGGQREASLSRVLGVRRAQRVVLSTVWYCLQLEMPLHPHPTRFSSAFESWVRRDYYKNERALSLGAQPTFLWDPPPKILCKNSESDVFRF